MDAENKKRETTLAVLIHVSTFSKYLIPMGNFIFPLIIWLANKKNAWINEHGRQAINFQISIFLYLIFISCTTLAALVISAINIGLENELYFAEQIFRNDVQQALPLLIIISISGALFLGLFVLELVSVITAAFRASEGKDYKYPLSIPFIPSLSGPEVESREKRAADNT